MEITSTLRWLATGLYRAPIPLRDNGRTPAPPARPAPRRRPPMRRRRPRPPSYRPPRPPPRAPHRPAAGPADHDDEHALQSAPQVVGGRLLQDRRPERRRDHVGGAAERQECQRDPQQRPGTPWAAPAANPKPTIATPHTTIATTTARPWRRTRGNHPENTPPATAPTDIAAANNAIVVPPSTGPPKLSWAICGNSARGMPKIIAIRSTTNDISTTGLPAR